MLLGQLTSPRHCSVCRTKVASFSVLDTCVSIGCGIKTQKEVWESECILFNETSDAKLIFPIRGKKWHLHFSIIFLQMSWWKDNKDGVYICKEELCR